MTGCSPADAFGEFFIRLRNEIERALVVAAREFHRGRGSLHVDHGEIEMRVGGFRIEFQRAAQFLLACAVPAAPAKCRAEVLVGAGIVRGVQHGLREMGVRGVEFIPLVGTDAEELERGTD